MKSTINIDGLLVEIFGPQFERIDGIKVPEAPQNFEKLRELKRSVLIELGLGTWDDPDENGKCLMLFPMQWYSAIPAGYLVEDINGKIEKFEPGVTDDDYRFGCLAYGIRVFDDKTLPTV